MKNKKLLRAAAALLVGVVGVAAAGCSFSVEQPDWLKQKLCDHVFDEQEILREPTCGRDGKTEKICSDCGTTKIVAIPATGEHTWDEGVTEDGMTTLTCTVCGSIDTQSKAPAACLHENYNKDGDTMRLYTCLDCGTYIPDSPTSAVSVGDTVGGWYKASLNSDGLFVDKFEIGFDWVAEPGVLDESDVMMNHIFNGDVSINFTLQSGYSNLQLTAYVVSFYRFTVDNSIYIFIPGKLEIDENVTYNDGETSSTVPVHITIDNLYFKAVTNIEKVG